MGWLKMSGIKRLNVTIMYSFAVKKSYENIKTSSVLVCLLILKCFHSLSVSLTTKPSLNKFLTQ